MFDFIRMSESLNGKAALAIYRQVTESFGMRTDRPFILDSRYNADLLDIRGRLEAPTRPADSGRSILRKAAKHCRDVSFAQAHGQ